MDGKWIDAANLVFAKFYTIGDNRFYTVDDNFETEIRSERRKKTYKW